MNKVVGLIGNPLGHSVSPAMQNAAFKHLQLEYEYLSFEIKPEELKDALIGFRALHFAGFNVTIPYKETILPLLDEITKLAKTIGAVNTVVNQNGRLIGYNTDGPGFLESLIQGAHLDPKGKKAVILGAGGASRAICSVLAERQVESITVTDIQEEKARILAEYIKDFFGTSCILVEVNSRELQLALNKTDLLVNTTPLGMFPKIEGFPLSDNIQLPQKILVYDLVYNPFETKLLKFAEKSGCKTCSGLGMLVHQGALAFTLWTGKDAPLEIMRHAAEEALIK